MWPCGHCVVMARVVCHLNVSAGSSVYVLCCCCRQLDLAPNFVWADQRLKSIINLLEPYCEHGACKWSESSVSNRTKLSSKKLLLLAKPYLAVGSACLGFGTALKPDSCGLETLHHIVLAALVPAMR